MSRWDDYRSRQSPYQKMIFDVWMSERPPIIQDLIRSYPPGIEIPFEGRMSYVVSFHESDGDDPMIGLSFVHPALDYDGAVDSRFFIHASCLESLLQDPDPSPDD